MAIESRLAFFLLVISLGVSAHRDSRNPKKTKNGRILDDMGYPHRVMAQLTDINGFIYIYI